MRREGTLPPFLWQGEVVTINDWLICYQFDHAVAFFGAWVENKREELDKDGKYRWSMEELLGTTASSTRKRSHRNTIPMPGMEVVQRD